MKHQKTWVGSILALLILLILCGCGKSAEESDAESDNGLTTTYASSTSTDSETSVGTDPALSYEISLKGDEAATTGKITTDNVLKVRFRITADQGNNVHQASELAMVIAVNGTEMSPTFTDSAYTYGRVGETSNLLDFSSYLTAGKKVKVTVKSPKNDFYCTYWGGYNSDGTWVNPLYNSYPGCRKAVNANHTWSGVLLVQTSSTEAI